MKPFDVKSSTYTDSSKENNDKDPKFKIGDIIVRISKYKNIFARGYMPNWSEELFVIKNLNGEEIVGTFQEKELQKTNQKEFKIEKLIRRKGDKLYVNWKSYNNSFNSGLIKKT